MPSNIIQWFPGHMAKTRRLIRENLSMVDIVIQLLDARIPGASQNPEITAICSAKPLLTVLTKSSLAAPAATQSWLEYYREMGQTALAIDVISGEGLKKIMPAVQTALRKKMARYDARGMSGRALKAMIVGIPNVGKSSLINKLCGAKKAKVENRPGVTTAKQWVTTTIGLQLLDTPGVLWPKFEDQHVGELLAMTGAIKDQVLDPLRIATALCATLRVQAPDLFAARYKLGDLAQYNEIDDTALFHLIGKKRGMLISGGEIDEERTANMLLDEFRHGKIGRITLERPPFSKRPAHIIAEKSESAKNE